MCSWVLVQGAGSSTTESELGKLAVAERLELYERPSGNALTSPLPWPQNHGIKVEPDSTHSSNPHLRRYFLPRKDSVDAATRLWPAEAFIIMKAHVAIDLEAASDHRSAGI